MVGFSVSLWAVRGTGTSTPQHLLQVEGVWLQLGFSGAGPLWFFSKDFCPLESGHLKPPSGLGRLI